jgi:hypothetical protein
MLELKRSTGESRKEEGKGVRNDDRMDKWSGRGIRKKGRGVRYDDRGMEERGQGIKIRKKPFPVEFLRTFCTSIIMHLSAKRCFGCHYILK